MTEHRSAMTMGLETSKNAPCDDLRLPGRERLRVVQCETCTRPGCRCQGHGALLLALSARGELRMPRSLGCIARNPHHPRPLRRAPAVSLFWHGQSILELPRPRGAKPVLASLRFDLAKFDPSALSLTYRSDLWEIAAWHQAPRLTAEEAEINAVLPPHLTSSPAGTIHGQPLVLVVQEGGSILGGLLARFALLQFRRRIAVSLDTNQPAQAGAPVIVRVASAARLARGEGSR